MSDTQQLGVRPVDQPLQDTEGSGKGGAADVDVEPDVDTPEADEGVEDYHNIIPMVMNDHDHIKGLYRKYKDPTYDRDQRQTVLSQLTRDLTVHTIAEEQVLYPVVGDHFGENARNHAEDEHQSLKLLMSDLDSMRVGDDGFEDKVHQLMEV